MRGFLHHFSVQPSRWADTSDRRYRILRSPRFTTGILRLRSCLIPMSRILQASVVLMSVRVRISSRAISARSHRREGCKWQDCAFNALMKYALLLLLMLSRVQAEEKPASSDKPSATSFLKRYLDKMKDIPVPEPASTPYDADPKARKAYMDAYCAGYRQAIIGYFSTFETNTSRGEAIEQGHSDGYRAGLKVPIKWKEETEPTKKEK